MKKIRLDTACYFLISLLSIILLVDVCKNSNQAMLSFAPALSFSGEYCYGDGEWKPLTDTTKLPSFAGDLWLRGQLTLDGDSVPAGIQVSFYLNHIRMSVFRNGEVLYESSSEMVFPPYSPERNTMPSTCGNNWHVFVTEEMANEDVLEIHLSNPHSYGNVNAYKEFLNSLHLGGEDAVKRMLGKEGQVYRVIGFFVIIVALILLGMAIGLMVLRVPDGSMIWSMGMMCLFAGMYFWLDTVDIGLRSNLVVFNTYARQLCMMLASLMLSSCVAKTLRGREKKAAEWAVRALILVDAILLVMSLADIIVFYDTGLYWSVTQGIVCVVLVVCCSRTWYRDAVKDKMMVFSGMSLLVALFFELWNARFGWWQSGICVKWIFVLTFVLHLARAVKAVLTSQQASIEAERLAGELRNSRVVLAMSQIRTHFIFNVLNAISGMCKYDPEKADETIVRFARYLRSNIDILQDDEPVPFSKELEHLEDYLALEQVRFEDKIHFDKNIEVQDFKIPPLVLQPLVENAIKHGLMPKPAGGTIVLRTREDKKHIVITVSDDGVGFRREDLEKEGSVGLSNVQFRLQHMVHGSLEIEEEPGKGTCITITIPRV